MIPTGTLQRHSIRVRTRRALALTLALLAGAAAGARAGTVELISKADPVPDSFGSASPFPTFSLSADGRYVVFASDAPNLVPGQIDQNGFYDVFVHDRVAGTTSLVTHAAGSPAKASGVDFYSIHPYAQISADGRYIVFASAATDLVPGVTDTNDGADVFLQDRVTGITTLVSHAAGEPESSADGFSFQARISADGTWIVFTSEATNLVAGQVDNLPDQRSTEDVFLYHRPSGSLTLLSHKKGAPATAGDGPSTEIAISADGGFVAFTSAATDLVSADANGASDVFLYQRSTRTLSLVSRASGGPGSASGASESPQISADGRFIAFSSSGGNLIPGQVNSFRNVFLFDRVSGAMRLASRTSASPRSGGGGSLGLLGNWMSADGRYLAFLSAATNLVPGQVDTNGQADVFVYDRIAEATALVSHARNSETTAAADPGSFLQSVSVSADGRFIAYQSSATNLISGQTDTGLTIDVFLYDRSARSSVLVSRTGGSARTAGNGYSRLPMISPDGSVVAFASVATNLGEGQTDPNDFEDLFLYHRTSAAITSLSRRDPDSPSATPFGPSGIGDMSADGRFVVFSSYASGLVPGLIDEPYNRNPFKPPETGTWDVFLRDRSTGKTTVVGRTTGSAEDAASYRPRISADGRFIVFQSRGRELVPGRTGDSYDLFLYDRISGTMELVSHAQDSLTAGTDEGTSINFVINADGRFIVYTSGSNNLAPVSRSSQYRLYLYDRLSKANTLVSDGNSDFEELQISADGRFITFSSTAPDLVPGQVDTEFSYDVFLFDRTTGTKTLLSHSAGSPLASGNAESYGSAMSDDGRFIVFGSRATDLLSGQIDTDRTTDLFLYERESGRTVLLSHSGSSPVTAANGESDSPHVSADGRFVVFVSQATDLVPGVTDTNGTFPGGIDVFLYDRLSGTNTLISHAHGTPATANNLWAAWPRISADGRRIAFLSPATDLVPGPVPRGPVYLFVEDRATGARTLVGRATPNGFAHDGVLSFTPELSADGRFLAFTSDSSQLVPGDYNRTWDAFVYDHEGSGGTVPPCTLFDTRRPADGPALRSGTRKTLTVRGACGVPATATEVAVRVSVLQPKRRGSLALFPGNATTPAATLRFAKGPTRTGSFTVPLSAGTLAIQPTVAGNGTIHVVLEIVGHQ